VTLGIQIKYYLSIGLLFTPPWYNSAVTAFFFLSLGVNTLTTALIVYKIVTVYNEIRGFTGNNSNVGSGTGSSAYSPGTGQRDLYPLISILIESGLVTFVGQLAQSIMYKTAPDAFPLVAGCVVMLYVRASCRLLILVFVISHLLCFTGNFDNSCPCACRDGHHLRPQYVKDGAFNQFPTPYSACTILIIEAQSVYYHRC
jgi:hypothetical protein